MALLSKKDIDDIVEIRQRIKKEMGVTLKLASPDLNAELARLCSETRDMITRSRIRSYLKRIDYAFDDPLERQLHDGRDLR